MLEAGPRHESEATAMTRDTLKTVLRRWIPPAAADLAVAARWRLDRGWHRQRIGGLWDLMGKHQFDFLVAQGLRPEHRLLDIGCGSLRGGLHFIEYLAPGNYIGIEKEKRRLDAALRFELSKETLREKRPRLVHMENFDFAALGAKIDFALAQSVFSHVPMNTIVRCVLNVDRVLAPGGRFFATFFESKGPRFHLEPFIQRPGEPPTHFDQNPFHYSFEIFEWISGETGLRAEYIGDWGHPRGQKMMVFTKR